MADAPIPQSITKAQRLDENRVLLAAAVACRARAVKRATVISVFAIVVPILLVAFKIAWAPATPVAVFYGLGFLLAMTLGLGRLRKVLMATEARILEQYDCAVLGLPWKGTAAGSPESDSAVSAWAEALQTLVPQGHPSRIRLAAGFPADVDQVPLGLARIVCQDAAIDWQSAVSDFYLKRIAIAAGAIVVVLLAVGAVLEPTTENALTTILGLAPLGFWVARERRDHLEAARRAERVIQRIESTLRNVKAGTIQVASLDGLARGIQDDVFAYRSARPVWPAWAERNLWRGAIGTRPSRIEPLLASVEKKEPQ